MTLIGKYVKGVLVFTDNTGSFLIKIQDDCQHELEDTFGNHVGYFYSLKSVVKKAKKLRKNVSASFCPLEGK